MIQARGEPAAGSGVEIRRYSAPTVAENLRIDEERVREASLDGRRVLRLWWGGPPTVVLGCADKPETACHPDVCDRLGIDVVKRITGGGTVLQTAGVLNYSLTMPDSGRLDIHRVFRLGADLIIGALARLGIDAEQQGISDVAVGDRKISGNAQARKRHGVLLHGTIMVDVDPGLVEAVLKHPTREPDYRQGRSHEDFIITLRDLGVPASAVEIERAVVDAAMEPELESKASGVRDGNKAGSAIW